MKTGDKFDIPKKKFFKDYTRVTDKFGDNINTKITKRIWGSVKKLNFDDIDLKQVVDRVLGLENPSKLVKRQGRKV